MEEFLRRELATTTLKAFGSGGGGCISSGQSYDTDTGKVFVKVNTKAEARRMFDGESASLSAIIATKTVRVPKPIKVLDHPEGSGSVFIMEHLDMKGLYKYQATLGTQVARMHLYNEELRNRENKAASSVHTEGDPRHQPGFGFHTTTCCGYIPQDNTWEADWVTFFTRHKLQQQMDLIQRDHGDREALVLWPELQRKIPGFFQGLDITPSLLHGDLWGGNVAENNDEPVIFDPASFYGHHEFELGIASMFGGFSTEFYQSYHSLIPRMTGFRNRAKLYKLFHYLNHWNHFGSGYRGQSISIMRDLIKS